MTGTDNGDYDPCVVCTEQQAEAIPPDFDGIHQNCPRCGEFKVTGTALAILGQGLGKEKRALVSGWVHEQNRAGALPMISSTNLKLILTRSPPSVADRATNLLKEAAYGQTGLSIRFDINEPRFMAATYSAETDDLYFLMRLLSDRGLIEHEAMGGIADVSPDGLMQLDELKREISASSQGFVAMWFDDSLNEAYSNGFELGILQTGYNAVRVDQVEHINRIDDEIIAQIKASKFVVADFTGHRGGVYFEAGYALGLNIPVFWTCRKDHMDELHFDIRQFNCIDWDSPDDLAARLSKRIEAVVGLGPEKALA